MTALYCYFLTLTSLVFAASLAARSRYVNRYKNIFFILSVLLNSVIIVTEILIVLAQYYNLRTLHIVSFVFNYICAPFLPCCITLMNTSIWNRKVKLWVLPASILAIIAISSPWSGLLFYVNAANEYSRGPVYMISLAICGVYFIGLTVTSFQEYQDADPAEKIYLTAVLLLAIVGVFVQVVFPGIGISTMWTTTAISLLLYYTLVQEMSNIYDVLTGVRNRMAFDACKEGLMPHRNYTMIIFDVNGLKTVNDSMGHASGDVLIMRVAKVLAKSFHGVGRTFRIGGDEFCIVCEDQDEHSIRVALYQLNQNISKENRNSDCPISVSYGVEIHKADDRRGCQEIFKKADEKMYRMKQEHYQAMGTGRIGA